MSLLQYHAGFSIGVLLIAGIIFAGIASQTQSETVSPQPHRMIAVIAHRGAHEHAPANTIPAIQAAIDLGADYVEIDVRQTKDGAFILMHDGTVDATTNGSGAVRDLTLAQIRALDAGIRFDPKFAGTRVPTLDEALSVMRGKVAAYMDVKDAPADSIAAILGRSDMLASVVYASPAALAQMLRINEAIRTMPEYSGSPDALNAMADTLRCDVVAISPLWNLTPEAVAASKKIEAQVFVDMMAQDNPDGWARAISYGVDGIQTDRPTELLRYLRERGMHQ